MEGLLTSLSKRENIPWRFTNVICDFPDSLDKESALQECLIIQNLVKPSPSLPSPQSPPEEQARFAKRGMCVAELLWIWFIVD